MEYLQTPHGNYRITQKFGENPSIYKQFGMIGHNGLDVAGLPRNYCLMAGEFLEAGYSSGGYGNYVKIKDNKGRTWIYGHFAESVKVRGHIDLWQDLGPMGTTGFSTGVHCHIGVKPQNPNQQNGYLGSIDPLPIIKNETLNKLNEFTMTEQEKQYFQQQFDNINQRITDTQNHCQKLENMLTNSEEKNRAKVTGNNVAKIMDFLKIPR